MRKVRGIHYDNFKDNVVDDDLHTAVGGLMRQLQSPPPTAAAFLPSSVVMSLVSPGGDPHDMDCVADHVGWALLGFGSGGHY
jgi:hypothetical protein